MQMKCPECEYHSFYVVMKLEIHRTYNYSAVMRTDLSEWESDFDDVYIDPCGFCSQCTDEDHPELCENMSLFDSQRNKELMTKPSEQRKLTVEVDSDDTDDEEKSSVIVEVRCENCTFSITDPEILAQVEQEWR